MKIKKISEFCKLNESQMRMAFNPNGHYVPKTEVELVEIVHGLFSDRIHQKNSITEKDIDGINIDLSQIRNVTDVTKNMVKRNKLDLRDFAFLYLLGIDKKDIENGVFEIDITDVDYGKTVYDMCADGYIITPFVYDNGDSVDDILIKIGGNCDYDYHKGRSATYWNPAEDAYVELKDETMECCALIHDDEELYIKDFPACDGLDKLVSQYDFYSIFDDKRRLEELAEEDYWRRYDREIEYERD